MNNEDLPPIMQAFRENPDAEIITIMGSLVNNGQHNMQAAASVENPNTEVNPIREPAMMNENQDLRNSNSALQQELGDLIREYNGQHNMELPLMDNDVLSRMQAEMDDLNADTNQNDALMDTNDTSDQELGDMIINDVNYQARYGEVVSSQEANIVPTIIVNTQYVAAIMQNAGIQIGEEEYLVDLEDGVASFAPIGQLNNADQFQFSQFMNCGIII